MKTLKNTLIKQGLVNKKQIKSILKKLVNFSNTVYNYLYHLASIWNSKIAASVIKSFYLSALCILEQSLEEIGKLFPYMIKLIPATLFARPNLIMDLKRHYAIFVAHLDTMNIDRNLSTVVQKGIFQMIHKKEITTINAEYCHGLMRVVKEKVYLDTESLTEILFLNGFNLPEFYFYCVTKYKYRLDNLDGLHEQLGLLLTEKG